MNIKDNNYLEGLHKAGLRATPQRIAICKYMGETETHPTASEIYDHLIQKYPSMSMATVYNTLDVLVAMGAVNALGSIGDDKVHFDGNVSPHINLACMRCHRIVDVDSQYVELLNTEISHHSGYQVLGSRVLYYGICPECQKKS